MKIKGKIINKKYKIQKKIGEGGVSTVWLSKDIKSNKNIAIKILKKNVISNRIEDLIRFRNEAQIISKLNFKNIVKIFEVGEEEEIDYIAMEYIKGKNIFEFLSNYEKNKSILSIGDYIDIKIKIVEAINKVHSVGIVHRDLKPTNIMIYYPGVFQERVNKWGIKIIDFGLASIKDYSEIKDKKEILGTFSYMSPEHCGIIKKDIDERSDLYSLGIIFYQLLTNKLPFNGDNISAIIHQHASKKAESINKFNKNIPEILNRIILKLLEKEPEKRYQSANGLLKDLKKVNKGLLDFELGLDDDNIKLNYRTNIIGRNEELNLLKKYYNNSIKSKGSICLISGVAGIGKTRLVNEFKNYVQFNNGIFIDGKCFSGKNKIPYSPFKDILNIYLKYYNRYSDKKKSEIKHNIKEFIGKLGRLILKLNPLFKQIIGECPTLVELESERENRRFLIQISNFFYYLAKIEKGLVLFIDDLHWMDEGSFILLHEIIQNISYSSLLIIGTYRNNEITKNHSIVNLINNSSKNSYSVKKINLNSFNNKQMEKFISNLLYNEEKNISAISNFILKKSKGNPFFSIEILKQLVDSKAIIFNKNKWNLNYNILKKIEIPLTIVDIVLKRILLLNEKETIVLSYAAIIGKKFNIRLLFELCCRWSKLNFTDIEVLEIVDKAIELQLLEKDSNEKGDILFVHDRIRDAFYKNINNKKRKRLHLDIAEKMEKINKNNLEYIIFDLLNHYILGIDKQNTLKYIFPAIIKSKENYAYDNAVKYIKIGIKFVEKYSSDYIKLNKILGEIYLIIGKSDDVIKICNKIFPFIQSTDEKAKLYSNICAAYFKKGQYHQCEIYGKIGFDLLGIKFFISKRSIFFGVIKELFVHIVSLIFFKKKFKVTYKKVNKKYKIMSSFFMFLGWIYSLHDISKFIHLVLFYLNRSLLKFGKSKELASAIIGCGAIADAGTFFKLASKYFQMAYKIRKSISDEWGIAQSFQLFGFYYLFTAKFHKGIYLFKKSINLFTNIGDIWEIATCYSGLHHIYYCISDYKNAQKCMAEFINIAETTKNKYYKEMYKSCVIVSFIETGKFIDAEKWIKKSLVSTKSNNIPFLNCITMSYQGYYYLEMRNIKNAVVILNNARKMDKKYNFLQLYTVHIYPFLADAYIENFINEEHSYNLKKRKNELKKIKKACTEALSKSKLWKICYVNSLRVAAKYYLILENYKKAEKYFNLSINLCEKIGRRYELAKGYYEYGKYFNKKNEKLKARDYWMNSYKIFKDIGAEVYMKYAADLIGLKDEKSYTKRLMDRQRLESVIGISQDLCSIMNITELLNHIMKKAVEVTGAQKGYLFIKNDETNELQLKAPENILLSDLPTYSKNIVNEVFNNGKYILTTNAEKDERYIKFKSIVDYGLKSILCIPMKYQRKIIGICYLDNPISSFVFTEEDADILNVFTAQAAIAIENANLYQKEKQHLQKLFQADKLITLGTIVSGVAHEINNPVNNIMINSNLLKKSYQYMIPILDEYYNEKGDFILGSYKYSDIKEKLNILFTGIINGSERIKRIINDLKNFSRKIPDIYFEDIDINKVVEAAITLIDNLLKKSTENFSVKYDENLPIINGNFQRLEQAVVNLIQNSCQALKSKKDSIHISTYLKNENNLIIEIKDEGIGMDEKTRKNILKPFFTTKFENGGVGLGLYITSKILKEHNGSLEFNSILNSGTAAKMILPIETKK